MLVTPLGLLIDPSYIKHLRSRRSNQSTTTLSSLRIHPNHRHLFIMKKSSSSTASTSAARINDGTSRDQSVVHEEIREQRRLRNIESAKRSRERLRSEPSWMKVQVYENSERIRKLENALDSLEKEVPRSSQKQLSKRAQKGAADSEKRPNWYGDAF